ncbi:MAG: DegT/DnrJ/EryC1/StrS family aminotransferase [Flavobacteriales bacterium]|nr:DegT/DnrJ/EryC1/StrS family aminotransferase [Flavobacteriales bacterium]
MSKDNKIWLSPPHISDNEKKFVDEAFEQNWIAPVGPHINKFEDELSKVSEGFDVAVLSSGTAAIHLALILLGVKNDDYVICSSFTFSASVNPIIYLGASPIFIDSEKDTWNMDPSLLEQAIVNQININKKPKAIILVHLYGYPSKIEEIISLSKKYDIPLIEDAAEALGSKYKNQPLGTFGDIGIFSFNGNKIITTSSGGAILSKNKEFIKKAKFLAAQAREDQPHYEHKEIGYNYRMSNICAAIGLGQLEVLERRVVKRRYIHDFYKKKLSKIKSIKFLNDIEGFYSNRWLTTIVLEENSKINNEKIRLELQKNNIESRPLWKPMHLQPVFNTYQALTNGISEDLFNRGLCLPSGSNMSDQNLNRVVNIIKNLHES